MRHVPHSLQTWEGYCMSQSERIEVSKSGRTCRGCGIAEHPAAPFVGGLCDQCCIAVRAMAARDQERAPPANASRAGSGFSIGRIAGIFLMIFGALLAFGFLGADTSVQTGPELGGQRIHNLALAQQQLVGLMFSLAMFIGGL